MNRFRRRKIVEHCLLYITIIWMEQHLANYKGDIFPNDNDIILIDTNKAIIWGAEWFHGAPIRYLQLSNLHLENIFSTRCLLPWQISSCVIFRIVQLLLQVISLSLCRRSHRRISERIEFRDVNQIFPFLVYLWDTKTSDNAVSVTISKIQSSVAVGFKPFLGSSQEEA